MSTQPLSIVALSGSLRAASVNSMLLRAAAARAPEGLEIRLYDYTDVPLYNDDIDYPESVDRLKAAIAGADGVLIASPEYNYSVPGVLKNAIDWASRPAYKSCFRHKPVGVMSVSPGVLGGVRAQQHLKTILLGMGSQVFPWAELVVGQAGSRFEDGVLTDETTQRFLDEYLEGFAEWVERVAAA